MTSPSPALTVISDREAKKLEKVLAQEAKAEQKSIKRALQDVSEAEKALLKCNKVCSHEHQASPKLSRRSHNLSSGGRQSTEESAEGQGYRAILCEGAQQGEAPARERAR